MSDRPDNQERSPEDFSDGIPQHPANPGSPSDQPDFDSVDERVFEAEAAGGEEAVPEADTADPPVSGTSRSQEAEAPASPGHVELTPPGPGEDLAWADDDGLAETEPEPEPEYELPPAERDSIPAREDGVSAWSDAVAAAPIASSCQVIPECESEIGRLWSQVFFAVEHQSPRAVVVTAARRGDGATQIACSLALVGAGGDEEVRVALVDFNLRNPQIADVFGIASSPGLSEVLEGRATLEAAIQVTRLSNGNELHVLTAGSPVRQPLGLLRSRHAATVVRRLMERFDHALFDCSAANAHPDAQIIGSLADGAILVARASRTPRETVADARKRLEFAGVRCLGLVMNQRSDPVPDLIYRNF